MQFPIKERPIKHPEFCLEKRGPKFKYSQINKFKKMASKVYFTDMHATMRANLQKKARNSNEENGL